MRARLTFATPRNNATEKAPKRLATCRGSSPALEQVQFIARVGPPSRMVFVLKNFDLERTVVTPGAGVATLSGIQRETDTLHGLRSESWTRAGWRLCAELWRFPDPVGPSATVGGNANVLESPVRWCRASVQSVTASQELELASSPSFALSCWFNPPGGYAQLVFSPMTRRFGSLRCLK